LAQHVIFKKKEKKKTYNLNWMGEHCDEQFVLLPDDGSLSWKVFAIAC